MKSALVAQNLDPIIPIQGTKILISSNLSQVSWWLWEFEMSEKVNWIDHSELKKGFHSTWW